MEPMVHKQIPMVMEQILPKSIKSHKQMLRPDQRVQVLGLLMQPVKSPPYLPTSPHTMPTHHSEPPQKSQVLMVTKELTQSLFKHLLQMVVSAPPLHQELLPKLLDLSLRQILMRRPPTLLVGQAKVAAPILVVPQILMRQVIQFVLRLVLPKLIGHMMPQPICQIQLPVPILNALVLKPL